MRLPSILSTPGAITVALTGDTIFQLTLAQNLNPEYPLDHAAITIFRSTVRPTARSTSRATAIPTGGTNSAVLRIWTGIGVNLLDVPDTDGFCTKAKIMATCIIPGDAPLPTVKLEVVEPAYSERDSRTDFYECKLSSGTDLRPGAAYSWTLTWKDTDDPSETPLHIEPTLRSDQNISMTCKKIDTAGSSTKNICPALGIFD